MNTLSRALPVSILVLGAAIVPLSGCTTSSISHGSSAPSGPVAIRVDGMIDEWPSDSACVADADYVYVRFTVKDAEFTLQHSPAPVAVYLDLDGNAANGVQAGAPSPDARGADMVIEFSPRDGGPTAGQGVAVYAVDSGGTRHVVRHADVDLSFAPTFASEWYELRVSRHPTGGGPLADLFARSSAVRGTVAMFEEAGGEPLVCDGFTTMLPSLGSGEPGDAEVPAHGAGSTRVVSWNVQKSSPVDRPDAFARVLKALDPDVVLLQEWDKGDTNALQAWFTAFVPSGSGWQVVKSADGDVAIASRYPLATVGSVPRVAGDDKPVRFVAAVTTTPMGDVLLGTAHLKCCGAKGSPEDARRMDEARAINKSLRDVATLPKVRVIGGDMNLVGTRPPLDAVRAGLDSDGTDLEVTAPVVLGDSAMYTWSDAANEFTPGRLDYVLWSGSSAALTRQFVLDTSRLNDRALSRAGLRRTDTLASDHLPVVVDVELTAPVAAVEDNVGDSAK